MTKRRRKARRHRKGEPYLWQHPNGYYYMFYYDELGNRHQTSLKTTNERDAEDRLYIWKQQREQERLAGKKASLRIAVDEARAEYLKHFGYRNKQSSVARYSAALTHVISFLGKDLPLQSIQVSDLQDYQLFRIKEGADKATIDYELNVFRTFLNWCRKREWVDENVASEDRTERLETKKDKETKKRIFTDPELDQLLSPSSAHGYWQYPYIDNLLYYTGCRIGEAAFLTTKDVSLNAKEIKIRAKTLRVPVWNRRRKLIETREVEWSPKSYEERIIPIDPRLLPILNEFEAQRLDNIYGLYFLTERGCQISDHVSRHLKAVTGKQDVSVHTFRHTHISHALNRWGRLPSVVQKMVGHKKLETTQLYLHVSREDLHREALKTG